MDTNLALSTIEEMIGVIDEQNASSQNDILHRNSQKDALEIAHKTLQGTLDTQLKSLTPEQKDALLSDDTPEKP